MERIKNVNEKINELMNQKEKILFNLFFLIEEAKDAYWVTDNRSYIAAQTNPRLPLWIWIGENADEQTDLELKDILTERLLLNSKLKVTADESKIEQVLNHVAKEQNVMFEKAVPMNIYSCKKVTNSKKAPGNMIYSNKEHKPILEKFITGMVDDLEHRPMQPGEAEGFANDVACSKDLYLWEDEKEVVSMAMIVHRTAEFARINTVYTDKAKRGKGYAGMLVGTVTEQVLAENRIPMLYTEQDNVCSNATYQRIGYKLDGRLTQFVFQGEA